MALDDKVRAYLRELGAALNEAVSSSEKVHEILAKVKAEGYGVVSRPRRDRRAREARAALVGGAPVHSARRAPDARAAEDGEGGTVETAVFQINVKDLSFLRSVGIDPTRPDPRAPPPGGDRHAPLHGREARLSERSDTAAQDLLGLSAARRRARRARRRAGAVSRRADRSSGSTSGAPRTSRR